MGLVAVDLTQDMPYISGAGSSSTFPAAIYRPLEDNDLYEPFIVQHGSGGDAYISVNIPPSGGNINLEQGHLSRLEAAIHEIRSTFGLTKSSVADICQVTRKTLYNWIDGKSTPKKETMNRIYDLTMASRALTSSGIALSEEQLYTPVVDGKSIFNLLEEKEIDKDLISFAGSRLSLREPTNEVLTDPFA